jgi:hypothetical protein
MTSAAFNYFTNSGRVLQLVAILSSIAHLCSKYLEYMERKNTKLTVSFGVKVPISDIGVLSGEQRVLSWMHNGHSNSILLSISFYNQI